jgi:hypothetical protein
MREIGNGRASDLVTNLQNVIKWSDNLDNGVTRELFTVSMITAQLYRVTAFIWQRLLKFVFCTAVHGDKVVIIS